MSFYHFCTSVYSSIYCNWRYTTYVHTCIYSYNHKKSDLTFHFATTLLSILVFCALFFCVRTYIRMSTRSHYLGYVYDVFRTIHTSVRISKVIPSFIVPSFSYYVVCFFFFIYTYKHIYIPTPFYACVRYTLYAHTHAAVKISEAFQARFFLFPRQSLSLFLSFSFVTKEE